MGDLELDQIRKARLEQLKSQAGGSGSGGGGGGGNGQDQAEQRKQAETEARASALSQILHPEAADRLGRIRLVKESRATEIENRLITMAQSGQLREKVTENQLKQILNAVADTAAKEEEKIVEEFGCRVTQEKEKDPEHHPATVNGVATNKVESPKNKLVTVVARFEMRIGRSARSFRVVIV
ncbi:uncharacterized protein MKZ38_000114 [Zalerion maritima]|uniref:Programmed cell death protein 5 n=1 Tax=Zalerion maritima TaxID=339359 RepID=A0AAD5RRU4_9PEZI|nr:uncharacterized protein MKZ38_000114 [Zalerion maritima]